MKEKFLMTSVLAAGVADVATTAVGLSYGFREIGFFGSQSIEMGIPTAAFVYRMAVSAVLIGLYAYSKEKPNRFSFSIDRATRISNIVSWGIVALNSIQLAGFMR